jgi:TPR repeat protein
VDVPDDPDLERGLAAAEAGRYVEAFALLRPFADAGDVEAQAILGSIVMVGMHRSTDLNFYLEWLENTDPDRLVSEDRENRLLAEPWLRAASDAGHGAATHNLSTMYVTGIGEEGWEERKRMAMELMAKARSQGFHSIDYGEPPGLAYLEFMERCAALHRKYAAKYPS